MAIQVRQQVAAQTCATPDYKIGKSPFRFRLRQGAKRESPANRAF
jgi:hypothetical protein